MLRDFFDKESGWSFGTANLASLKNERYLHIPMTREIPISAADTAPAHVVDIDRGLRFLVASYDERIRATMVITMIITTATQPPAAMAATRLFTPATMALIAAIVALTAAFAVFAAASAAFFAA